MNIQTMSVIWHSITKILSIMTLDTSVKLLIAVDLEPEAKFFRGIFKVRSHDSHLPAPL